MHPVVKRYTSAFCMVLLVEITATCRVAKPIPSIKADKTGKRSQERLRAVTLRDGRYVAFAVDRRVELRNDTLHAFVWRTSPQEYRSSVVGGATRTMEREAIALADVERFWGSRVSAGRTLAAVFLGFVGTIAVLVGLIAASSCPFIYSWDGEQWILDAEPYGGAITKGLERVDFARLEHATPDSAGLYRLMLKNEAEETQFTNDMRLLVVDHAPGTQVEIDETGTVRAMYSVLPPTRVTDRAGVDLLPRLRTTDHVLWEPNPPSDATAQMREEITFTFPKPANATHAFLVANVATGEWGAHMLREILLMRGGMVKDWYAAIDTSAANRGLLHAWNVREELWVLQVLIEEHDGWHPRALLGGGGPYASETKAVALDVSRARGDSVRIRVRPPIGFWSFNSFGVSYSANARFSIDTLAPVSARTAQGEDVSAALASKDDRYYEMPFVGDSGFVSFRAPPMRPGLQRDVFLATSGYYRLHLPESGVPDFVNLMKVTNEPDAAARISAQKFVRRMTARTTAAIQR